MPANTPFYKIERKHNVIHVNISGVWTIPIDLAYLTELSATIDEIRTTEWAMVVDMRGWDLPPSVFNSPFKSKTILDRRSQTLELWIVDQLDQAEELLRFFKNSKVKPQRFLDLKDAHQVLQQSDFTL